MAIGEIAMLAGGLVGVALLGMWHLGGLLLLMRIKPSGGDRHALAVLVTFWGLLLLHFSEIIWCALMLEAALALAPGSDIGGGIGDDPAAILYFAGVSFATLGYTEQTATGPIKMLVMLLSLGGFMLITWSATFVYSIWEERFR